jgi:CubicO group peptidase (beta-lactamase class C family)
LSAFRCFAQQNNKALERAVDRLVREAGIDAGEPGVAILVAQPGRPAFKKGYGLATLEDKKPITPATLFELASLTKPFTATAVLMLVERKKLSLDDDVRKHLPELPVYDAKKPIRIRHLLNHTSGLPDYLGFDLLPATGKGYWNGDDYLPVFAREKEKHPLNAPTGEKFEYSNTNYMLLALIVARVSGQPFGEFLRDHLFRPAAMNDSFVMENPETAPKPKLGRTCAIGYTLDGERYKASWGAPPARSEQLLTVGDGAIWSSLDDMGRFDAALRENRLLKADTFQRAIATSKTDNGDLNTYGFGWSLYPSDAGGLNGWGHDGGWQGFQTSYYHYEVADRTTVVLSNRGDFDVDAFWYKLNGAIEAAWKN